MDQLQHIERADVGPDQVTFHVDGGRALVVEAYGPRLFRARVTAGEPLVAATWAIAPERRPDGGRDEVPPEGFPRETPGGRARRPLVVEEVPEGWVVATDDVRAVVRDDPVRVEWQARRGDAWVTVLADRATGAYAIGARTGRVTHHHQHLDGDRCYGLGEQPGSFERTGRRHEFRCLDAMGYDAATTSPLYKHWPFLIVRTAAGPFVGVFWDNTATTTVQLAHEKDNYHRPYRTWSAELGEIDHWVLVEDHPQALTQAFTELVGGTSYPPTWSLGYSGSTMHYTDADDAQEQVLGFLDECDEHAIPVDLFQLSSGYTTIDGKRYVFHWNRDKFPDPAAFARRYRDAGAHLAANIKPALLHDHPRFDEVRDLVVQGDDGPALQLFWDDVGANLDFTNPATIRWWSDRVREELLEQGIESTWNDNNEFEVWDERARCVGFGRETPMAAIRPVHTLLMVQASARTQAAFAPHERQYLITRSGMPGVQRWAETWSGDNHSSWRTLRYNTLMGLGMSVSGMLRVGHDVGGFAGSRPSPELFTRWVQNGALHPRFTIHSWHDDGTVNEPWMYPEQLPAIRAAMRLRYRLLPYLAHLSWRAHVASEPIIKPLAWGYPDDERAWGEHTDFLLGDELLVASVVEEGEREHRVHLPDGGLGWYEFDRPGRHFAGGQTVTLDAPLDRLPVLVRAGGAVPVGEVMGRVSATPERRRQLLLFPAPGEATTHGSAYADDGHTHAWRAGEYCLDEWELRSDEHTVRCTIRRSGAWTPPWGELEPVLPPWEGRRLVVERR
ncbi:TIM-barrel domain-containing protein [uncultured Tessaracoccus sp.]|uniref:glycoside hydrolase family 31 protein n=1 Tax=uncultured Tessaracoccus sp. TaxID=905023 RepID=UPI0025D54A81|nr:TIM-barrel domain-containing protein [uncultured Tessaracoccus sp.]